MKTETKQFITLTIVILAFVILSVWKHESYHKEQFELDECKVHYELGWGAAYTVAEDCKEEHELTGHDILHALDAALFLPTALLVLLAYGTMMRRERT